MATTTSTEVESRRAALAWLAGRLEWEETLAALRCREERDLAAAA